MATITDFSGWLDQADPENYEEIYSLYKAIEDIDEPQYGTFKCTKNEKTGMYFLKGDHTEDTLLLASEKARLTFIKVLDDRFKIDGSIEGWYEFHRLMEKDLGRNQSN